MNEVLDVEDLPMRLLVFTFYLRYYFGQLHCLYVHIS